ncbi:hypothetical protein IG631_12568 [Alternaria alternata]|nr:hypothetical protein IG631_12568 [Alternaria alternata]
MTATWPLLVTSHFPSPRLMSIGGEHQGIPAYLHALQPFFDRAGRGGAGDDSATGTVVAVGG